MLTKCRVYRLHYTQVYDMGILGRTVLIRMTMREIRNGGDAVVDRADLTGKLDGMSCAVALIRTKNNRLASACLLRI